MHLSQTASIQRVQGVEPVTPPGTVQARRIFQIEDRFSTRAEFHALVATRQEPTPPEAREQALIARSTAWNGNEDNERWQVFVFRSQTVIDPGAHAGPARLLTAGLEERDRGVVVDRFGMHRSNQADFVGNLLRVGQQIANPASTLSAVTEPEFAGRNGQTRLAGNHACDALPHSNRVRQVLIEARL